MGDLIYTFAIVDVLAIPIHFLLSYSGLLWAVI